MKGWLGGLLLGTVGGLLAGGLLVHGEDLTITTYYPSPRGVYDELRANELVAKRVTLADRTTGRHYTLAMDGGKLLITDVKNERAFVMIEFPEDAGR